MSILSPKPLAQAVFPSFSFDDTDPLHHQKDH